MYMEAYIYFCSEFRLERCDDGAWTLNIICSSDFAPSALRSIVFRRLCSRLTVPKSPADIRFALASHAEGWRWTENYWSSGSKSIHRAPLHVLYLIFPE